MLIERTASFNELFKEYVERANRSTKIFIGTEALKIYANTQNEETALRALELMEKAARLDPLAMPPVG